MFNAEKIVNFKNNIANRLRNIVNGAFEPKNEVRSNSKNLVEQIPEVLNFISSLPKKVILDQIVNILNQVDSKTLIKGTSLTILLALLIACNPSASKPNGIDIPGATPATTSPTPEPALVEVRATETSVAETEEAQTPAPTETPIPNYLDMYGIDESEFENLDLQVIVELIQSEVGYEEGQTLHIDENSQYIQLDNQDNNTIAIFDLEGNLVATLEKAKTIANDLKLVEPNDLVANKKGIFAVLANQDGEDDDQYILELAEGEWAEFKKAIPNEAIAVIISTMGDKFDTSNLTISENGTTIYDKGGIELLFLDEEGIWQFSFEQHINGYSNDMTDNNPIKLYDESGNEINLTLRGYYGSDVNQQDQDLITAIEKLKTYKLNYINEDEFIKFLKDNLLVVKENINHSYAIEGSEIIKNNEPTKLKTNIEIIFTSSNLLPKFIDDQSINTIYRLGSITNARELLIVQTENKTYILIESPAKQFVGAEENFIDNASLELLVSLRTALVYLGIEEDIASTIDITDSESLNAEKDILQNAADEKYDLIKQLIRDMINALNKDFGNAPKSAFWLKN